MEKFGLSTLVAAIVFFIALGIWAGLRRPDDFWNEADAKRRVGPRKVADRSGGPRSDPRTSGRRNPR